MHISAKLKLHREHTLLSFVEEKLAYEFHLKNGMCMF